MAESQTVAGHLKSHLVTGTIIIWGSILISVAAILIEYFSTGHSVLLLAVVALVITCAISLIVLSFILRVLHCLDTLELWMNEAGSREIVPPVPDMPFVNKATEPIVRACNALTARLKGDSYRRVLLLDRLAHDMRSSLASIQGYAEVLIDYNVGLEGASLQTYGKIIAGQTYRLVKMVEDVQTVVRISEHRFSLEVEPVRPAVLLGTVIAEARKNSFREITYQEDIKDCLIEGDSYRLREMMSKLIEIALSFSTSYVSIDVQVEEEQAGCWVKIHVEDHSKGLSVPELNALIHPFEPSMDRKTSPIFNNGMSFYIIQAIVDGHKGTLNVQSQPGQGNFYKVLLPVQKVKE